MQSTNRPYKGILISFEGIDGSGKTTLSQRVAQALKDAKKEVVLTKEPGGTPAGAMIRAIVQQHTLVQKAEFLLFAADRAQHMEELVIPALKQGKIVISDRMGDSSLAYQGYGRGVALDMINFINSWAAGTYQPDITVYVKVDPQTALKRVIARNEKLSIFEKEKLEFFEKIARGFDEIFAPRTNVITVDGTPAQELVFQETMRMLHDRLS